MSDTEMLQSLNERNFKHTQAERRENIFTILSILMILGIIVILFLMLVSILSPWFSIGLLTEIILMVVFIHKSTTYEAKEKAYREISTEEMLKIAEKLDAEPFSHLKTTLAQYVERGFMTCGELESIQSQVEEIEKRASLTEKAKEWKQKAEELNQSTEDKQ